MHPESMFPPELMSALVTSAIGIVLFVVFIAVGVLSKKARDERRRGKDHGDCLKTPVPEGDEQKVCVQDQYAQSMVRPYLPEQEEDCPECPPCYCKIHGVSCPDIFKTLRNVVEDFTMESQLHEGSRFELGQAAAFTEAARRLRAVLDELEGKDKDPG